VVRLGFLKVGGMRRTTAALMGESMGFTSAVLTPNTNVKGLSGGERQGLAIVRALHFQAEIIIAYLRSIATSGRAVSGNGDGCAEA